MTDVDGCLVDRVTRSHAAADAALDRLKQARVPVVLCSSKTRAELERLRQELGLSDPFISENGGGIFVPDDYFPFPVEGELRDRLRVISLGMTYGEVRRRFAALRDRTGIAVRGFGDMGIEEVAALTGLTVEEARLAKQRDFEEPFLFPGRPDDRFLREIEGEKLRWTQGKFFHLMGDHHKGRAVNILRGLYDRGKGPVTTIGIGDSLNDLPFLLAVDRPVLVRKGSNRHDARLDIPGLVRADGIGPAGWNEAVLELLK